MENPNPSDATLTEDDRMRLGAQQAAMIHLQEENVRRHHEMQLRDDVLVMPPQHGMINQESRGADQNLIQMQAAAMAEKEKEAELLHQQQMAIMERSREEHMMKQQMMMPPGQQPPPQPPQPPQQTPPPPMPAPPAPPGLGAPRMPPPPAPPTLATSAPPPPPPHLMGPPGLSSSNQHMPPQPPGLSAPPHLPSPQPATQSLTVPPPGTTSSPLPPSQHLGPPPNFSQPPPGPPGTQPMPPAPQFNQGPSGPPPRPPGTAPQQPMGPPTTQMQPPPSMPPPPGRMIPSLPPPSSQPGPPGLSNERPGPGYQSEQGSMGHQQPPPPHLSHPPPNMRTPPPGYGKRPPPPNQQENQSSQNQGPPPGSQGGDSQQQTSQQSSPSAADSDKPREVKLPQALEKVLAFKGERASQVGVAPEDIEKVEKGEMPIDEEEPVARLHQAEMTIGEEYGDDDADEEEQEIPAQSKKESKNKKRKKKKKRAKQRRLQPMNTSTSESRVDDDIDIEYIQEAPAFDTNDPMYSQFAEIFKAFKITEPEKLKHAEEVVKEEPKKEVAPAKIKGILDSDDDDDDDELPDKDDDDKPKISKKKMKKMSRLSVAELKQLVHRPDVVEMHDVTARDPKLLVLIKATRNTVTVPRHWCFKRKYLQGKRGIEKPPFELPEYIKQTGIMEMRAALAEKEDQKSMKQKMRERVRPKMGKIDIDYQKLHDAFFKWQIKPKMTIHGDLYYEGKEFETRLKEKKPGNLSDDLRTALGMPIGANAEKVPPPWLIAMQRYGPPPSYPNLKIPGLNAPIPEGCSFGYHAGGWGKPPVDENGKPLYGDVFGVQGAEVIPPVAEEEIDKSHWGELESESESEEESEEESDEEGEGDMTGLVTPGETGLVTPSGVTSVPIGVETPDMIELRKRRIEDAIDQGGDTPALYTILPEKKATVGGAMMGSAHVYDMSAVVAGAPGAKGRPGQPGVPTEGVDIALNPEELDMDTAAMQAKYEQTMREQQQSQLEKEDLSDMVAEHAAKQQKKRKKQQQDGKSAKKYKDFKF